MPGCKPWLLTMLLACRARLALACTHAFRSCSCLQGLGGVVHCSGGGSERGPSRPSTIRAGGLCHRQSVRLRPPRTQVPKHHQSVRHLPPLTRGTPTVGPGPRVGRIVLVVSASRRLLSLLCEAKCLYRAAVRRSGRLSGDGPPASVEPTWESWRVGHPPDPSPTT